MIAPNRRVPALGLVFAAALIAACASSGPSAPPDSVGFITPEEVADDPNREVCRRIKPTGSRLTKKVCKTAREWELEAEESQEEIRNIQHSGIPPKEGPTG